VPWARGRSETVDVSSRPIHSASYLEGVRLAYALQDLARPQAEAFVAHAYAMLPEMADDALSHTERRPASGWLSWRSSSGGLRAEPGSPERAAAPQTGGAALWAAAMAAFNADEVGVVEWRLEPEAQRARRPAGAASIRGLITRYARRFGGVRSPSSGRVRRRRGAIWKAGSWPGRPSGGRRS
jgi:hypothetical protein